MPKVTILPLAVEIETAEGTTIMGAAQAEGYYWPTTCGGEGRCTTCACVVVDGLDHLSEMGRAERRVLVDERGECVLSQPVRLACQARVYGDVLIEKSGVRRPITLATPTQNFAQSGE